MNLHSQDASGRDRSETRPTGRSQPPKHLPTPAQGPGEDDVSLAAVLKSALEHKRTILSVALVFLGLSALYVSQATPLAAGQT